MCAKRAGHDDWHMGVGCKELLMTLILVVSVTLFFFAYSCLYIFHSRITWTRPCSLVLNFYFTLPCMILFVCLNESADRRAAVSA